MLLRHAHNPGRTRTCNHTVMSGRTKDAIVDSAAFSLAFDRVHCALVRSFLVQNRCSLGPKLRRGGCSEPRPIGYYEDLLAHNLKVIGSNPIPATRKKPANSVSWRVFSCSNLSKSPSHGSIQ